MNIKSIIIFKLKNAPTWFEPTTQQILVHEHLQPLDHIVDSSNINLVHDIRYSAIFLKRVTHQHHQHQHQPQQ